MNASKARRRWITWCRYIQKTNSATAGSRQWMTRSHRGQAKAYTDVTYAKRYVPIGGRNVWYPRWASVKER